MKPIEVPAAPQPDPLSDPLSVAVVSEIVERGYPSVTVADVAARAEITVAQFHRRFRDLDDSAIDTYERLIATFERRVVGAFNGQHDWRTALRAAAYEVADFFEENPYLPRFGMTEILRVQSELARVRREELFVYCEQMIEQGREAAPDPGSVPEGASVVAVGSILQMLTHRLQQGVTTDYQGAVRESVSRVVGIFLGEEAAREELSLPRPLPTDAAADAAGQ